MKKYKNIDRYEYNTNPGWYVRVMWKGKQKQKLFIDRHYGGKTKSLKSAVEFRDASEVELGKPRTERKINKRGLAQGIREHERINGAGYAAFSVTYTPKPGQTKRKYFSIKQNGRKKAKVMASVFRKSMVEKYYS